MAFHGVSATAKNRVMWRNLRLKPGLSFALKTSLALTLLIAITQHWGHYYVEALLPLYRGVINLILRDYDVVSLSLSHQNTEAIVAAHLITIKSQIIGGHTLPAGVTLDASTLAGHALKHVIIVFTAILIWPALSPVERGIRCLVSLPLLLLLEAIDIPFVIAGSVQDLVFFNLSSNYATNKPLSVTWLHMLDGGGRLALSVLVALIVNLTPTSIARTETKLPSK